MVYHVPNLVSYQMFTTSQQYCLYLGMVLNKMLDNTIFGHMYFKDKFSMYLLVLLTENFQVNSNTDAIESLNTPKLQSTK